MKHSLLAALCLASIAFPAAAAPAAHADDTATVPLIDRAEWVHWGDLTSLRVYPSPAARHGTPDQESAAWAQVLALAPDADLPGMRDQFDCHWELAELAEPGKTSWNLEPWRPVVDSATMVAKGCNPGGTEEPF